jgi:hypothetical protein
MAESFIKILSDRVEDLHESYHGVGYGTSISRHSTHTAAGIKSKKCAFIKNYAADIELLSKVVDEVECGGKNYALTM